MKKKLNYSMQKCTKVHTYVISKDNTSYRWDISLKKRCSLLRFPANEGTNEEPRSVLYVQEVWTQLIELI